MRTLSQPFSVMAAASAVLASLLPVLPDLAACLGLGDSPSVWEARRQLAQEVAFGKELSDVDAVALRRSLARDEVVNSLLDGRLSLSEAVARLRGLDREQPSVSPVRGVLDNLSDLDDYQAGQGVIAYSAVGLQRRPDRAAVARRLETELADIEKAAFRDDDDGVPAPGALGTIVEPRAG